MANSEEPNELEATEEVACKLGGPIMFGKVMLGWKPHDAQYEILTDKSQYKTIAAGRRFGKSEMCAVDILWYALHGTTLPNQQFIISQSQDQANIIYNAIYAFASNSPKLRNRISKIIWTPFPEMKFDNGSSIHARSTSYDGKYLRGRAAHRIFIDEAAFIKDNIVKEVVLPMLTDWNGDIVLISTPNGRNYFYEMFEKGQKEEEGTKSWQFASYTNPHISHKHIDEQKKNMLDLQFRTEYLAEFIDDQHAVFKWEHINDSLEDFEESFERHPSHIYYIGVDVAVQTDYTAITVIDGTDSKNCKIVYTERFNNKSYEYIFGRVMACIINFQPFKVLVDETGVGAGITEQLVAACPQVEGFTFSMPAKISLINTLKLGLEQNRIRLSKNNDNLINELKYYEYERTDQGNIKMHAPTNGPIKFDDCVISLALAFQSCSVPLAMAEVFGVNKPQGEDKWLKETNQHAMVDPSPYAADEQGNVYVI